MGYCLVSRVRVAVPALCDTREARRLNSETLRRDGRGVGPRRKVAPEREEKLPFRSDEKVSGQGVPTTEQRYTSVVGTSAICPAAAAARISLSEKNCCGGIVEKTIWTSCQSGLNPSPWIASRTLVNVTPAASA